MKKTYMKPETAMQVVNIEHTILAGSGGVETGSKLGEGYNKDDVSYGNGGSLWDDEEEEE